MPRESSLRALAVRFERRSPVDEQRVGDLLGQAASSPTLSRLLPERHGSAAWVADDREIAGRTAGLGLEDRGSKPLGFPCRGIDVVDLCVRNPATRAFVGTDCRKRALI